MIPQIPVSGVLELPIIQAHSSKVKRWKRSRFVYYLPIISPVCKQLCWTKIHCEYFVNEEMSLIDEIEEQIFSSEFYDNVA